jgi:hypothetical protein
MYLPTAATVTTRANLYHRPTCSTAEATQALAALAVKASTELGTNAELAQLVDATENKEAGMQQRLQELEQQSRVALQACDEAIGDNTAKAAEFLKALVDTAPLDGARVQ